MSYLTNSSITITGDALEDILQNYPSTLTVGNRADTDPIYFDFGTYNAQPPIRINSSPQSPDSGYSYSLVIDPIWELNAITNAGMTGIAIGPRIATGRTMTGYLGIYSIAPQYEGTGVVDAQMWCFAADPSDTLVLGGSPAGKVSYFSWDVSGGDGQQAVAYFRNYINGKAVSGAALTNFGIWLGTVSGATVNNYGIKIEDVTGTGAFALHTSLGPVNFGDIVLTPASTTARASLRLPHGSAPTSPVNGDAWTTSAGLFIRINGATVGPLT